MSKNEELESFKDDIYLYIAERIASFQERPEMNAYNGSSLLEQASILFALREFVSTGSFPEHDLLNLFMTSSLDRRIEINKLNSEEDDLVVALVILDKFDDFCLVRANKKKAGEDK